MDCSATGVQKLTIKTPERCRSAGFLLTTLNGVLILITNFPANIYLFKVNNSNIRKRCEIYSKLTIKTPERRH